MTHSSLSSTGNVVLYVLACYQCAVKVWFRSLQMTISFIFGRGIEYGISNNAIRKLWVTWNDHDCYLRYQFILIWVIFLMLPSVVEDMKGLVAHTGFTSEKRTVLLSIYVTLGHCKLKVRNINLSSQTSFYCFCYKYIHIKGQLLYYLSLVTLSERSLHIAHLDADAGVRPSANPSHLSAGNLVPKRLYRPPQSSLFWFCHWYSPATPAKATEFRYEYIVAYKFILICVFDQNDKNVTIQFKDVSKWPLEGWSASV